LKLRNLIEIINQATKVRRTIPISAITDRGPSAWWKELDTINFRKEFGVVPNINNPNPRFASQLDSNTTKRISDTLR
jgi:hypothetical protein